MAVCDVIVDARHRVPLADLLMHRFADEGAKPLGESITVVRRRKAPPSVDAGGHRHRSAFVDALHHHGLPSLRRAFQEALDGLRWAKSSSEPRCGSISGEE